MNENLPLIFNKSLKIDNEIYSKLSGLLLNEDIDIFDSDKSTKKTN